MKTILLAFITFLTFNLQAQTTHNINWFIGADPGTLVIEAGDTVNWIWTDGAPHTVTSMPGSTDTFDSGVLPSGSTFSREFPNVGTNPYQCDVHPSMNGVIEVGALSVDDNEIINLEFYPNPVKDWLFIDSPVGMERAQLFDINGKLLMDAPLNNHNRTSIFMGVFKSGLYFVRIQTEEGSQSLRIVLQ